MKKIIFLFSIFMLCCGCSFQESPEKTLTNTILHMNELKGGEYTYILHFDGQELKASGEFNASDISKVTFTFDGKEMTGYGKSNGMEFTFYGQEDGIWKSKTFTKENEPLVNIKRILDSMKRYTFVEEQEEIDGIAHYRVLLAQEDICPYFYGCLSGTFQKTDIKKDIFLDLFIRKEYHTVQKIEMDVSNLFEKDNVAFTILLQFDMLDETKNITLPEEALKESSNQQSTNNIRYKSAMSSAVGYLDSVESAILVAMTQNSAYVPKEEITTIGELESGIPVNFKGQAPTSLLLKLKGTHIIGGEITISGYTFLVDQNRNLRLKS